MIALLGCAGSSLARNQTGWVWVELVRGATLFCSKRLQRYCTLVYPSSQNQHSGKYVLQYMSRQLKTLSGPHCSYSVLETVKCHPL